MAEIDKLNRIEASTRIFDLHFEFVRSGLTLVVFKITCAM
jgi:hypothetical protein